MAAAGDDDELRAGPLTLAIDVDADRVEIRYVGESVARAPLSPDRVYAAWSKALQRLESRATAPDVFRAQLGKVYAESTRDKPGGRASLPDVHFRIFVDRQSAYFKADPQKARIRDYAKSQFAWDLGALLAHPDALASDDGTLRVFDAPESSLRSPTRVVRVRVGEEERALGDLLIR